MIDYNICGVMVHAVAEKRQQVEAILAQSKGVEVHANSNEGKLVVTVESDSSYHVADTISSFRDIDGVLSASMIYQYSDAATKPNEGIPA